MVPCMGDILAYDFNFKVAVQLIWACPDMTSAVQSDVKAPYLSYCIEVSKLDTSRFICILTTNSSCFGNEGGQSETTNCNLLVNEGNVPLTRPPVTI